MKHFNLHRGILLNTRTRSELSVFSGLDVDCSIVAMFVLWPISVSSLSLCLLWPVRMQLEDFCYYFEMMSICCENPNFIDGDLSCQWKCRIYEDSWVAGISAGGNISDSEPLSYCLFFPFIGACTQSSGNVSCHL